MVINSKSLLAAAALMPLSALPLPVQAWNFEGHVIVAEIAYQNLTPVARDKVDALTAKAVNALPKKTQHIIGSYKDVSAFAQLAVVPDMIRKQPAQSVWQQMGEAMPPSLNRWDEKKTNQWHYINAVYPTNSQCNFVRKPNIQLATQALYADFNGHPQAASLMFIAHLTGDAHQPLHTVATSLSKYWCKSDLGGNKYTLKGPKKNLHHLWDDGLGLLDDKQQVLELVTALQQEYPKATLTLGQPGDVARWIEESEQLAPLVYSVKQNAQPTQTYIQQGQAVVEKRLALAGYRLADGLNHALGTK
ncbi:S1/P1 nuclease [Photobacterium japonica]|uniref:S1/P1 nuclease n=1 Tax=Photobacterium japonica TaxID=2910235 RepID=UPI003D0C73A7